MPEIDKMKDSNKTPAEGDSDNFSLIGKFDGQRMLQAVVMSDLLGKPKAKRRKRGRFKNEGTHCR